MAEQIPGLSEWRNPKNGFYVIKAHYLANPNKRLPEWRAAQSKGLSVNDWNREYEIDFSSFSGKPVFMHDYDDARMWIPWDVSTKYPIIRSWDFGYHHPAVSWCQFVDGLQFVVLQSDMGNDIDFRLYVRHIQQMSAMYFPDREFHDCCDRAGSFVSSTGDPEVKILVSEFGIIPRYKYFLVDYTIGLVRDLMNGNYRNQPRFIVNAVPSNNLVRDALRGGYHYREKSHGHAENAKPEPDGFYENAVDPIRYAIANFLGMQGSMMSQIQELAGIDIIPAKEDLW